MITFGYTPNSSSNGNGGGTPHPSDPVVDPYGQCCPAGARCIRAMPTCPFPGGHPPECAAGMYWDASVSQCVTPIVDFPHTDGGPLVPDPTIDVGAGNTGIVPPILRQPMRMRMMEEGNPLLMYVVFGLLAFTVGSLMFGGRKST